MPLYDYRCHKCGETFEVRQKFADELLKTHEACGGELERLISAPALQFKGTGWYVNDYGRGGKLPSSGSDESKSESAKSDTPKSEGSKSEGSKSEGSKSEGSKSESSKSETKKSDTKKSDTKSESKTESKPVPASTSSDK